MLLFATDLDGTLVDRQDGIHPRDLAAISAARERGVVVTIATGRLTSRTHPIAQVLALDTPLVCADGGVLACSTTQRVLRRRFVPVPVVEEVLEVFQAASLATCVMTDEVIHACRRNDGFHHYLKGWASTITTHVDIRSAVQWQKEPEAAIMLVGIGAPAVCDAVVEKLAVHASHIDVVTFDASAGPRVVRVMAKGATKGSALAELAQELGIDPSRVAVAGDWLNDLSMFAFAGRSFAMPHAPAEVRAAATHALDHDIVKHGSFADALEEWVRELG